MVERDIRWLSRFRRLAGDQERLADVLNGFHLELAPIGADCCVAPSATLPPSAAAAGWSPVPSRLLAQALNCLLGAHVKTGAARPDRALRRSTRCWRATRTRMRLAS